MELFNQKEINLFVESLSNFLHRSNLQQFVSGPIDHFAYKAGNTAHYEELLNAALPMAVSASFVSMDNRRIAMLYLEESIQLGKYGECFYVEIMEPRPEKVGKDLVGVEHIEIFSNDILKIKQNAQLASFSFEEYENVSHQALVFKINDKGQEIKFTNKHVQEVLQIQEKKHTNVWIKHT